MARWEEIAETLAAERYAALCAYANMLTAGDRASAEDLTHDAFVRVFGRGRSFNSLGHAEYYVRRAILTLFLDSHRSRKRRAEIDATLPAPPVPLTPEAAVASADGLRDLLAHLTPQERACAVLRYVDDLTIQETASRLKLAPGTVKRYLSNAAARLGDRLPTDPDTEGRNRVPVVAPGDPKRLEI